MLCIIQARMSSKRLPGKVLLKINNKSILELIIERIKKTKIVSNIVVATSNKKSDYKIVKFCKKNCISYHRGSLENVAQRFLKIAKKEKAKEFIRINGDSPLIDPKLIDKAAQIYKYKKYDLVTNSFPKLYPKGQSVEVVRTKTFNKVVKKINKNDHKEHVTKYYYDNAKNFLIFSFVPEKNYSRINLSIDTQRDFDLVSKIYKKCKNKILKWEDLIVIYKNLKNQ